MAQPIALAGLLKQLARLPGLGPRSAQRVALSLLAAPEKLAELATALQRAQAELGNCNQCGNIAARNAAGPCLCELCTDPRRDGSMLCVVETVADIWALEKGGEFKGRYHVLGGVVSALQGVSPDDLSLGQLEQRLRTAAVPVQEVILALGASLEGQTTSHLVASLVHRAAPQAVLSTLAKGMPVGASVDYLDEGTLGLALLHRQRL
ncbi:MAG: recombination protein RecR [Alphaproteobacteria bacterium]|nr:recombination protein RecR [Alphaproteobacteria bacterium]